MCFAKDAPSPAVAPTCTGNQTSSCQPKISSRDRKTAHRAFERGLDLEKSDKLEQALSAFGEAARLVPMNVDYLSAREVTRQRLATSHLDRGNALMAQGKQDEALEEFQIALNLDPSNEFTQQRVVDAAGPAAKPSTTPQVVAESNDVVAAPLDTKRDIHYSGDSRGLLTMIGTSYGMTVLFDDNFPSRRVRFDIQDADFATAMRAASIITKSYCVPIESTVIFATLDSLENRRLYERMGARTFYIPGKSSAAELNEVVNTLRSLLDFRFVSVNAAASTITVRGPVAMLQVATQLMGQLNASSPEVLLDVQVMEVSHTYARNIGLHVPNQFKLFNIPAAALAGLSGQNLQDLINQLISSGGINQAGNESIQALLAQLMGQGNSIFSQPLATFGGGITLMGLTLDQLSAVLSLNESSVKLLQHVTLRASQLKDATFKLGSRYPVLNASFAPISNSAAIAGVLQNQSFTAPFPSVSYEDLGLTIKAKPMVHNNLDVAMDINMQFRTLAGGMVNGVPIISNREFNGGILLKNGEPAAIAGMVTEADTKSLNGLPAFARIPGLGVLTSQSGKEEMSDELLIVLTPHVVLEAEHAETPEIYLPR